MTLTDEQAIELIEAGLFDPPNFARVFYRIKDKHMRIIPFVYNAAQWDCFHKLTGRDIIIKPRQIGFSTMIQSLNEQAAMFSTANVATFADTADNAKKLREIGNRFYREWPQELLAMRPPRGQDSIKMVTYPMTDSESVIATAGSKTSGRAATYSRLHLSEFAFYDDQETIMATAMQALTPDGAAIIETTTNGAQGLIYQMVIDALDGKGEWRLHFYPWWWAPEYSLPVHPGEEIIYSEEELEVIQIARRNGFDLTPGQIKWRRSKLSGAEGLLFKQEYPETVESCFLTSGRGVFGDINHCLIIPYRDQPIEGHYMVAGIDWGQSDDYTALSIIDADTREEVFIGRVRHMPWIDIIDWLVDHCKRWNVTAICAELNSMGANVENLERKIYETGMSQTVIWRFTTTNESKRQAVHALYNGIHQDGLKLLRTSANGDDDRDYAKMEMNSFVNKQTALGTYIYDHADGAKSDTVIARMLCYNYICRTTFGF